jgi:[ribosomal protein S18]-alanine N-acetyltransferase
MMFLANSKHRTAPEVNETSKGDTEHQLLRKTKMHENKIGSFENRMSIQIRKLRGADEAASCAEMMANSEPWITLRRGYEESLRLLTNPLKEVYVALSKDQIVGFIVLDMEGDFSGYVQSVYVAPGWRKQGIGHELMAFAEKRIFSESPNAFVCVSSFNKDAQRLYQRLGYEVVGELKDFIVRGHSEILLRKSIGPESGWGDKMN